MAIELEVRSDSRQAHLDLERLKRTAISIRDSLSKNVADIKVNTKDVDRAKKEIAGIEKKSLKVDVSIPKIDTSKIKAATTDVGNLNSSFKELASSIALTATSMLSLYSTVKVVDAVTNLDNRLQVLAKTSRDTAGSFLALRSIALESRQSIASIGELYNKLSMASERLGASQKDVAIVTSNVSKLLASSGTGAQQAQAAVLQLGQALSSGVLQGDELRSISENAPKILDVITKQTGFAREQLRILGAEGKLTSKLIFDALKQGTSEADASFAKTTVTFEQAFTNMGNAIFLFTRAFMNLGQSGNGVAGWINDMALGIAKFSQKLDIYFIQIRIKFLKAFLPIKYVLLDMISSVVNAFKSLEKAFPIITRFVETIDKAFAWLYDRVIGNSWVPDLIDGIIDWFNKILDEPLKAVSNFAKKVSNTFKNLIKGTPLETLFGGEAKATIKIEGANSLEELPRDIAESLDKAGSLEKWYSNQKSPSKEKQLLPEIKTDTSILDKLKERLYPPKEDTKDEKFIKHADFLIKYLQDNFKVKVLTTEKYRDSQYRTSYFDGKTQQPGELTVPDIKNSNNIERDYYVTLHEIRHAFDDITGAFKNQSPLQSELYANMYASGNGIAPKDKNMLLASSMSSYLNAGYDTRTLSNNDIEDLKDLLNDGVINGKKADDAFLSKYEGLTQTINSRKQYGFTADTSSFWTEALEYLQSISSSALSFGKEIFNLDNARAAFEKVVAFVDGTNRNVSFTKQDIALPAVLSAITVGISSIVASLTGYKSFIPTVGSLLSLLTKPFRVTITSIYTAAATALSFLIGKSLLNPFKAAFIATGIYGLLSSEGLKKALTGKEGTFIDDFKTTFDKSAIGHTLKQILGIQDKNQYIYEDINSVTGYRVSDPSANVGRGSERKQDIRTPFHDVINALPVQTQLPMITAVTTVVVALLYRKFGFGTIGNVTAGLATTGTMLVGARVVSDAEINRFLAAVSNGIFGIISKGIDILFSGIFAKDNIGKIFENGFTKGAEALGSSLYSSTLMLAKLALLFKSGREMMANGAASVLTSPTSLMKNIGRRFEANISDRLAKREVNTSLSNLGSARTALENSRNAYATLRNSATASARDVVAARDSYARALLHARASANAMRDAQANMTAVSRTTNSIREKLDEAKRNTRTNISNTVSNTGGALGTIYGIQVGEKIAEGMVGYSNWAKVGVIMATALGGQLVGAGVGTILGSIIATALTSPITIAVAALGAVAYGIYQYFTDPKFKQAVDTAFEVVKTKLREGLDTITSKPFWIQVGNDIRDGLLSDLNPFKAVGETIGQTMFETFHKDPKDPLAKTGLEKAQIVQANKDLAPATKEEAARYLRADKNASKITANDLKYYQGIKDLSNSIKYLGKDFRRDATGQVLDRTNVYDKLLKGNGANIGDSVGLASPNWERSFVNFFLGKTEELKRETKAPQSYPSVLSKDLTIDFGIEAITRPWVESLDLATNAAAGFTQSIGGLHRATEEATKVLVAGFTADSPAFKALIKQESQGNPNAISPKGAVGLAQVMPATYLDMIGKNGAKATAKELAEATEALKDPATNMKYGLLYFNKQVETFGGDLEKAYAAYNAGPGNVIKATNNGVLDRAKLPKETQSYLVKTYDTLAPEQKLPDGKAIGAEVVKETTSFLDSVIQTLKDFNIPKFIIDQLEVIRKGTLGKASETEQAAEKLKKSIEDATTIPDIQNTLTSYAKQNNLGDIAVRNVNSIEAAMQEAERLSQIVTLKLKETQKPLTVRDQEKLKALTAPVTKVKEPEPAPKTFIDPTYLAIKKLTFKDEVKGKELFLKELEQLKVLSAEIGAELKLPEIIPVEFIKSIGDEAAQELEMLQQAAIEAVKIYNNNHQDPLAQSAAQDAINAYVERFNGLYNLAVDSVGNLKKQLSPKAREAVTNFTNSFKAEVSAGLKELVIGEISVKDFIYAQALKISNDIVTNFLEGLIDGLMGAKDSFLAEKVGAQVDFGKEVGTWIKEKIFGIEPPTAKDQEFKAIEVTYAKELPAHATAMAAHTKALLGEKAGFLPDSEKNPSVEDITGDLPTDSYGKTLPPLSDPDIVNGTKDAVEASTEGIVAATDAQTTSLSQVFSDVGGWITKGINSLGTFFMQGFQSLSGMFSGSFGGGGSSGGSFLSGIGSIFSGVGDSIGSFIGETFGLSGAGGFLSGLFFADGGKVAGPGTSKSDSIPAWLSNGEFVVNAESTKKYMPLLQAINSGKIPKFAEGGLVGAMNSSYAVVDSAVAENQNIKTKGTQNSSVFNINITGDVSRQTRTEIQRMLPQIATGVNMHNRELGIAGNRR